MNRILFLLTALLFSVSLRAQPVVRQILDNGPTDNRVNLVFLAEGFTTAESENFFLQSSNVLTAFLAEAPFSEYKNCFNAFAIFVPSAQSGSDHPDSGVFKDTYFNSSYDTYGYYYSTSIPPNDRDRTYANGYGKADEVLNATPFCDIPIMIVNDPAYGGSGGRIPMTSVATAARQIAIHEIGHSFAGLGDEYEAPFAGFPVYEEPNTTRETNRNLVKWKAWIDDATPVPTPNTFKSQVGLFEGARYFSTGWYRPQPDCKMRTLGVPFCAVCSEALVLSIYKKITPIDSFSPATNTTQQLPSNNNLTFTANALNPTHPINIQWFLDDKPIHSGASINLSGANLSAGAHTLKAIATDPTPRVRTDPSNFLTQTISWTLNAAPSLTARLNGNLTLSYPSTPEPYSLESSISLGSDAIWATVKNAAATEINGQLLFQIPIEPNQRFFRLSFAN